MNNTNLQTLQNAANQTKQISESNPKVSLSQSFKKSRLSSTSKTIPKQYNKSILAGDQYTNGIESSMKGIRTTLESLSISKAKANMEKEALVDKIITLQSMNVKSGTENSIQKGRLSKLNVKMINLEGDNKNFSKQISITVEESRKKKLDVEDVAIRLADELNKINSSVELRKSVLADLIFEKKAKKKAIMDECKQCEDMLMEKEAKIVEMKRQLKLFDRKEGSREKYLQAHIHLIETLLDDGRLTKLSYSQEKAQLKSSVL